MSFVGLFFGFMICLLPVKLDNKPNVNESEMRELTNGQPANKSERLRTESGGIYRSAHNMYASQRSIATLSTKHVDSLFQKTMSLLKDPIYLLILIAGNFFRL